METRGSFYSGLYARALGPSWGKLAPAVQGMHVEPHPKAMGTFEVRHGRSIAARFLVRLLRMPRPASACPVSLSIAPFRNGERWLRTFDGQPLRSRQALCRDGCLSERILMLEFRFRLSEQEGALIYRQERCALRLGRLSLPLPAKCAPLVQARESAADLPDTTHVLVSVTVPVVGRLIEYEGTIRKEGSA